MIYNILFQLVKKWTKQFKDAKNMAMKDAIGNTIGQIFHRLHYSNAKVNVETDKLEKDQLILTGLTSTVLSEVNSLNEAVD